MISNKLLTMLHKTTQCVKKKNYHPYHKPVSRIEDVQSTVYRNIGVPAFNTVQ